MAATRMLMLGFVLTMCGCQGDQTVKQEMPKESVSAPAVPAELVDGQVVRVGGDTVIQTVSEPGRYKEDSSEFTMYTCGKHVVNTPLPNGYPAPTPPGAVELKRYPSVRRAEVARSDNPDGALFGMIGGKNAGFWPLFRHIQKRGIAMTAPVETDLPGTGESKDEAWKMAFLYRSSDLGPSGPDERGVVVRDQPAMTVLALGVSGNSGGSTAEEGVETLRDWLATHPEWTEAGPARVLNYNDPFTRPQWSEVQLMVAPAKR